MLIIDRILKRYGNERAVANISLKIPQGICFGLVGPNGAGKSTLMKIIATIIQADEGQILLNNQRLNSSMKKLIGYVPQEICVEQTVSAIENLKFFGKLYGLKGTALKKRVHEVLAEIGLEDKAQKKVSTFSGGMKRRLNIGCALMNNPQLILMDEPTVGIDPQSRKYIYKMIEAFKKNGRTIIYASHYIEEVEQLCDEVAVIDDGHIIEQGLIDALYQKYSKQAIYVDDDRCLPPNIKDYGHVSKQDKDYVITTDDPLEVMEKIIAFCRRENRPLNRITLNKHQLEDIFFSLTGSQLRDS